jgi:hypothetical protein
MRSPDRQRSVVHRFRGLPLHVRLLWLLAALIALDTIVRIS